MLFALPRPAGPARPRALLAAALAVAGCQADTPPPAGLTFLALPIAGPRSLASAAGFDRCVYVDAVSLRCRKSGVALMGAGPYEAAVDMRGKDGRSGFGHLTLWHDDDQRALYPAIRALAKDGWTMCFTGTEQAGDQAIFTKAGAPVRIYMDISYYGKRRIRIFPPTRAPRPSSPCLAGKGLGMFGISTAD